MNGRSIHIYPTLRCNGKCPYCSNVMPSGEEISQYNEVFPERWIELMGKLNVWDVYFTGGEVFLYGGIKEIIENIPESANFYTNGTLMEKSALEKANPKKIIFRCSYHPRIGSIDQFLEKVEMLRALDIPFQICVVDAPENDAPDLKANIFRPVGHEIVIFYDQRKHHHKTGKVRCQIRTTIAAPDGTIYPCVSKMVRQKGGIANIFENGDMGECSFVICDEPESCTPCDLAAAFQEQL